jgi:Mn-dependent DtxR family transcriptional regulator
MQEFYEDQLRSALEDYLAKTMPEDDRECFTSSDVAQALGIGKTAALARLRRLRTEGVIEPAIVRRLDAWGYRLTIKGYKFCEGSQTS